MKRYIVFAGVNGAGKTTLYQTNDDFLEMQRINMDEIVREFGSWKISSDVSKAGKIAVNKIKRCFEENISFNQETTLCGKSIINHIKKAKKNQYRVELYYVGLDSVAIAKERVAQRVKDGGHGIPDIDIERRYYESLKNLKGIIPLCDRVEIYDNTKYFRLVAIFDDGKCIECCKDVPQWCRDIIN